MWRPMGMWLDQIEHCTGDALFKDLGRFSHLDLDQTIAIDVLS